jgi:hypothetical protein
MGIGGAVVALALVYFLARLDVVSARDETDDSMRGMLVVTVVPLVLTFGGVVVFNAASIT